MIERDIITQKFKEFRIKEFINDSLRGAGLSHSKIQKTPLGEKIVIYASKPGLVIGSGGSNIKELTRELKKNFDLENPQIEINEIKEHNLVAQIVAERIAVSLERYGPVRFKGIGHSVMGDVIEAGALGVEILISGKIPSSRARTWRFYQGYLKKCGDIALTKVDTAYEIAKLKTGIVGVKVSIMPPGTRLPDDIEIQETLQSSVEETEEKEEELKKKIDESEKKEKKSEQVKENEQGTKK
ncbi:30S ribosomal protein S3 [Candidatus Woesearchaeota archaeon]|nr:30S ribosomal protein S3 [Candidatus Woesearchaeota archaeon]